MWEPDLRGVKLGHVVDKIRNNNHYKEHAAELQQMGFAFGPQQEFYRWDKVRRALQAYKSIYGDLLVPSKFAIPQRDAAWERDLRGMNLGGVVRKIRNRGDHGEHRRALQKMGFDYSSQKGLGKRAESNNNNDSK